MKKQRSYTNKTGMWMLLEEIFRSEKPKKRTYPIDSGEIVKTLETEMRLHKYYQKAGLCIDELCIHTHTNRTYLTHALQKELGVQFCAYVNSFRIEEAKKLLSQGEYKDLDYEEISHCSGFGNTRSFYRVFSKMENCTPRQYAIAVRRKTN